MSYTIEERKQILKGQCLNNASTLISGWTGQGTVNTQQVLDFAQKLYDDAMERNWLQLPTLTPPELCDVIPQVTSSAPVTPPQPTIMI